MYGSVDPVVKKATYADLYAAEAKFQQLEQQYKESLPCKDGPCTDGAVLNAELQSQLGIVYTILTELKPKQYTTRQHQLTKKIEKLDKEYDQFLQKLDQGKTYDEKNIDLSVMAGVYHESTLAWGFGAIVVILLCIGSSL